MISEEDVFDELMMKISEFFAVSLFLTVA